MVRVCFIGGTQYLKPLAVNTEKKIEGLGAVADVYIIGFSSTTWPNMFFQHAQFYLVPRIPVRILRYVLFFLLAPAIALWCVLVKKVDVLVAQSPYEGSIGAFVKKCAGLLGVKVALIVETHGDFENAVFLQNQITNQSVYRVVMQKAALYAVRNADSYRVISKATHEQLRRIASDKPMFKFPTWTDMDCFVEAKRDESETRQYILYCGVITPLKGIHHLVNAFATIRKEFPDTYLVLAGKQQDKEYFEHLTQMVNSLKLGGSVEFIGEVDQARLASYMANAFVMVLPSLSEGLGRVLFEAMATSTPVIGSRVGGIPEIIDDGETGLLVEPGDEDGLTSALQKLLRNPSVAQLMGEKGRNVARDMFSTKGYIEHYKQMLKDTLDVVHADI